MTTLDSRMDGAVNHLLVMRVRQTVAERMAAEGGLGALDRDDAQAWATSFIAEVLGELDHEFIMAGRVPLNPDDNRALVVAVIDAMFGALRFAYRADDSTIENLIFRGANHVVVYRCDNTITYEPSPFSSAEDLCNEAEELMVRCGAERAWNDATAPFVDLRLPDGSRFTGVRGLGDKTPTVFLRRPRAWDMTLEEMRDNRTIDWGMYQFLLAAAGEARLNLLLAGATDSGKTTALRSLCHCAHLDEHLITIENARELGLKMFQDRHRNVTELEYRPPNGEGNGEVTIARLVEKSLRMRPDRIINGEVLGDEVVPMLKGLSEGHSGMTTIHAQSAPAVVRRLCAYAGSAPERLPFPHTESLIPDAINFVVFLRKVEDFRSGRWYRTVGSIHEVIPQRNGNYIAATMSAIFDSKGAPDKRARPTGTRPDRTDELEAAGFDPTLLQRAEGWWA